MSAESAAKKVLRRLAILACGVLFVMTLVSMIPRAGFNTPYSLYLVLACYFAVTGYALLAVERPAFDQRPREIAVIGNVLAAAFPVFIWAKLLTGTLPIGPVWGLLPAIGFTLLAVTLLWTLEAGRYFAPQAKWTVAVVALTFASFAIMVAGGRSVNRGGNYAAELAYLDTLATVAGVVYTATAAVWLVFLYQGLTRSRAGILGKPVSGGTQGPVEPEPVAREKPEREAADQRRSARSELARYDVEAIDGRFEYMGTLYETPEDAIAAAKRDRGEA